MYVCIYATRRGGDDFPVIWIVKFVTTTTPLLRVHLTPLVLLKVGGFEVSDDDK